MSRAFVNEDAPSGDVYIPPRAPLPHGAVNFVTPRGLGLLEGERNEMEAERERLKKGDPHSEDRNRSLTIVRGRLKDLEARIIGAKVVPPSEQPADEVRFGAKVTVRTVKGRKPGLKRTFRIVGVDEADIATMRVGWIAPIARALTGLPVGGQTTLMMGGSEETLEIVSISYPED
ncbi:MAG: GreA/GreB family elongation factor [Bacteroidetes bacterium]|nr:GreA/GreB family elongation factor [Bacteroidota bacterium]